MFRPLTWQSSGWKVQEQIYLHCRDHSTIEIKSFWLKFRLNVKTGMSINCQKLKKFVFWGVVLWSDVVCITCMCGGL